MAESEAVLGLFPWVLLCTFYVTFTILLPIYSVLWEVCIF